MYTSGLKSPSKGEWHCNWEEKQKKRRRGKRKATKLESRKRRESPCLQQHAVVTGKQLYGTLPCHAHLFLT